jgi:hypothetical protein
MIVKGNPPQLPQDIRRGFQESTALAETMTAYDTVDHGHGCLEERHLTARTALVEDSDGPGLAQVCQVERRVTVKKSGAQRAEVVYGVTSLSPERARPEGLWRLVRQHWPIENQVHGVRDVTFDEDRSHVRGGRIPQHGHRLDALGRGDEYRSRLSPLCRPAVVGVSPDRHHTGKLNGPAWGSVGC